MKPPRSTGSEDLLPRLRGLVPTLVPSLQRVAQEILRAPEEVSTLTISELAQAAHTSETTVVRLCRELGMRGFRDLRLALAAEQGREQGRSDGLRVGPDIGRDDSVKEIVAKISYADQQAVADTARILDKEALAAVIARVAEARRVNLFGVGASAFVALDLQQKLHRIGIVAFGWQEEHAGLTAAALTGPQDVTIGVSHTGMTLDTIDVLEEAARHGSTTVALTSVPRSPLARMADYALITASRETTFRSGAMGSRIAALSVVDMIFVGVAQKRYDLTMEALQRTRRAVAGRRAPGTDQEGTR